VNRFATRRLIDACAALDAADRALLNLWVNRGLKDGAVARMTNMTEAAVAQRRARIVDGLSQELGLPPAEIREALGAIAESGDAGSDRASGPPTGKGAASGISRASAHPPAAVGPESSVKDPDPQAEPSSGQPLSDSADQATPARPPTALPLAPPTTLPSASATAPPSAPAREAPDPRAPTRRRAIAVALGLLLVAVVAIVVVVAALGSSPTKHPRVAVAQPAPAPSPSAPAASPTSPSSSPSPPVSPVPSHPLGALPGGLGHATGTVLLIGPRRHLKLRLTVRHVTAARFGHYEVWLYNSIIDAEPLGRLRTGVRKVTLRLPANAHRFRWIDISFQPIGFVNHSGESVLRAANPATARTLPKKRSARRRRLRATIGGLPRPRRSR